ncbi:Cysteine synthase [Halorhabdus sp. SVX81]|uniref:cysteine synthase A n=1 Tax=Halorhabdus sp. SVX81 TaxID=2978283 RepID=UPI0023DCB88E|nr:cysteine synthase A [Halorhabdus sp. SVX81]WEL18026.1 Cysteine synthase [Halorhabdus sp. SVX81]
MHVADDVTEFIGDTPLLRLDDGTGTTVLGKVESLNPYSVKDRIGKSMIEAAEETGKLTEETVVIEPTSGNTGIGLASVCAAKGYDLVLTMPESMSEERRQLLAGLGAELELTDADGGMGGAIDRAHELADEYDDAFVPQQFENPANPAAHRDGTGPELWDATDGELDAFVAGIGTGGTITGIGQFLRDDIEADVDVIGVEPEDSAVLSGEEPGSHGIQGIGAGFVPEILEMDLLDDVVTVTREESIDEARRIASEEGLAVGISCGAAAHAATQVATDYPDDAVVATVLPDTGERYLSTDLYATD